MHHSDDMLYASEKYPKQLYWFKMNKLVNLMKDKHIGVKLRDKKGLFSSSQNIFTGQTLIEWLKNNLEIPETEAQHVAILLFQHGYLYPTSSLINNHSTVKVNSEEYRFQDPFYWITVNWQTNDIQYAIYLLQCAFGHLFGMTFDHNEEKTLDNLRSRLSNHWDMIEMQSQASLNKLSAMKKSERRMIIQQQKYFWSIMKATTTPNVLENDMKGSFKMEHKISPEKYLLWEIDHCKRKFKKVKTPLSKFCENLCATSEILNEHDSFITPCEPCNPWVEKNNRKFWELNARIPEQPTRKRVELWQSNFIYLLKDPLGVKEFHSFLTKEFSTENLNFWLIVQDYRHSSAKKWKEKLHVIYKNYLERGSPTEINVDVASLRKVAAQLDNPQWYSLEAVENHIYNLMKKDSYQRFIKSDHYKELLSKSYVHITMIKKRNILQFSQFTDDEDEDDMDSDIELEEIGQKRSSKAERKSERLSEHVLNLPRLRHSSHNASFSDNFQKQKST
ncbi:hypothetical protein SNEBB_000901 [Seison nebaliae]|nr:hypothetical protein SNEBB_000901 [Seison nebaliae]